MNHKALYKSNAGRKKYNTLNMRNMKVKDRANKRNELHGVQRGFSETNIDNSPQNIAQQVSKISKKQEYYTKFLAWQSAKIQKRNDVYRNKKQPFNSAVPIGRFVDKTEEKPKRKNYVLAPIPIENVIHETNLLSPNVVLRPNTRSQNAPLVSPSKLPQRKRRTPKKTKQNPTLTQLKVPLTNTELRAKFKFSIDGPMITSTAQKPNKQTVSNNDIDLFSPIEDYQKPNNIVDVKNNAEVKSNQNHKVDLNTTVSMNDSLNRSINYVSPFVTISRGKVNAHVEKETRDCAYKLTLNQSIDEPIAIRQNKEAALYFRKQLDTETTRLLDLVSMWEQYKNENSTQIEEAYIDLIDVTIGQTRLLTTKKFNQFRELVQKCEQGSGYLKVLPKDLEGFWEMVYIQVENCITRFAKLDKLKSNNWIDVDVVKKVKIVNRKAAEIIIKPKSRVESNIIKLMEKARKEMRRKQNENIIVDINSDHQFIRKSTPRISTPRKTPARKSLFATVLNQEASRVQHLSTPSKVNSENILDNSTKGILKSSKTARKTKSVVFLDANMYSELCKDRRTPKKYTATPIKKNFKCHDLDKPNTPTNKRASLNISGRSASCTPTSSSGAYRRRSLRNLNT